jgi:hypothetical protein
VKPILAVLLVVAALTGGAAAGVAGNPRDERVRLDRSDMALARRAVLRRDDLPPGWASIPPASARDASIRCAGYDPDLSRFTVTGRARSSFLARATGASVASSVQVFPSAAQASGDFRLATRPALMACVSAHLVRELRSAGAVTARVVSRRMSAEPRVGAQSATFRFVLEFRAGPAKLAYHVDLVTFRAGRAIGVMSLGSVGQSNLDDGALARAVAARMS